MRKILIPVAVVAVIAAIALHAHHTDMPAIATPDVAPASVSADTIHYPQGAPQLAYLKIQAIHATPAPLFAPMTARLVYDEDRTYRAVTPVNGRVLEILANPGDHVRRGQALARLQSTDYESAISDNAKARSDLDAKRAAFDRANILMQAGVIARKDYEGAQDDLGVAEAEARRTQQQIHALGASSGSGDPVFVLRSRIDGIVAERQISAGQQVSNDASAPPLFVVTDPAHLWISIDVAEQNIAQLQRGQALDVQLDSYPGQHFHATLRSISISLDPATRRLPVTASIDNSNGLLHPEMFAHVYAIDDKKQAMVALPNSAIFTKGLYSYVWVETSEGTLQRRQIALTLQLPDVSYAVSGVADGERVVTSGALLLDADTTSG